MIVGGQTEACTQLSSTIIDYHEPFDQGLRDFPQTKPDNGINSPFLLNEHGDYLVFASTIFYLRDTIHFIQYHTQTLSVFSRGRT